MGTWGAGPLQNETAEDVLDSLREMSPEERLATVEGFFKDAVRGAETGRVLVLPEEVVAGACVVAASGAAPAPMPWLQDNPEIRDWLPAVSSETVDGARRALGIAVLENGQYWSSWVEVADKNEAREALALLVGALS